jgi:hypothetical protein
MGNIDSTIAPDQGGSKGKICRIRELVTIQPLARALGTDRWSPAQVREDIKLEFPCVVR